VLVLAQVLPPRVQQLVEGDLPDDPPGRRPVDHRRGGRAAAGELGGSAWPSSAPSAQPIMNVGASTPPDVPEPSESDHAQVLHTTMLAHDN